MKKTLAFLLVLAMMLSVGVFSASAEGTPVTDWVNYQTTANEMEYWNILRSQGARDLDVLTNCIDGLLTNDPYGNLISNVAESWETTDGGRTWTFKLREGVTWVDYTGAYMADCVAEDWLYGLEWVLNFWKNDAANTSMPIEMISGAGDYYTYTKGLTEESTEEEIAAFNAICEKYGLSTTPLTSDEAKALDLTIFSQMVGVEAPDALTLVYTCFDQFPYFATLTTYNCLYPLSGKLIETLGVETYGTSNETIWYNGPYTITTYVMNNEKVFTPNPSWWNTEAVRFDSVTTKMVESIDVAYQLYQTGEVNYVQLSESNLQTIYRASSHEFHDFMTEARPTKYSYQIHFVYDKKLADGTADENWNKAVANEAFRLSWYYGLDMTNFLSRTNAINPLSCTNYCYTMINVATTSGGVDYTQLVMDELGLALPTEDVYTRYDPEKAAAYKAQAMEELAAQGVTFPINIDYYIIGASQTALDTANVLKQMFSDYLGDDFVTFTINTYVTSLTQEVRLPRLASFFINGWGADYGDPQNYCGQETYGEDNAYYSNAYSNINDATDPTLIATYQEYTDLVHAASDIKDDLDARYAAYAKAEAYFISHALTIPTYINITWQLTCVNDYSKVYAAYGIQNNRYINWETKAEGCTTADYAAYKEAYEANR